MRKQLEIEPEKFRHQYEVHTMFRVGGGVKTRVGLLSETTHF